MSTVARWVTDLTPKQLRAVARNAKPLKTRVLDVVGRVLSGRGGATDPHGHSECSGGNSSRPISGRSRGIEFTCVCPSVSGRHKQNGDASGIVLEVLHANDVHSIHIGPVFQEPKEPRPCGILLVLGRLRRFQHRLHVQVLDRHQVVPLHIFRLVNYLTSIVKSRHLKISYRTEHRRTQKSR